MPLNPPPKAKKWGQADEDILYELLKYDEIDIGDTSLPTIERIRRAHFQHRSSENFRRNFRNYVARYDLEHSYRGARRRAAEEGRLSVCFVLIIKSISLGINLPYAVAATVVSAAAAGEENPQEAGDLEDEVEHEEEDDEEEAASDEEDAADEAAMPPKKKPAAPTAAAAASTVEKKVTPPPAPKPSIFNISCTDVFGVSYFCEGSQDFAEATLHVNGVLRDIDYRVSVAPDGKSINYVRAVRSECFTKEVLQSIMGTEYSTTHTRVIAYDDVAQEMLEKKVISESKLYWGEPQVVRLKWECTGTHKIFKGDYAIDYVVRDPSGRKNRQRNTILIVRVKKAKERSAAAAEVVVKEISLLGVFSQGSSNDSPPPRHKRARPKGRHEVQDEGDDYGDGDGYSGGGGGGMKGSKYDY